MFTECCDLQSFTTQRLLIREYRRKDIDDFLYVIRQPEVRATTYGIPADYPKSRAKRWFRFLRDSKKNMKSLEYGVFMRDSGKYVGNVGLINISLEHRHADISYYMDKDERSKGIATEASSAMLRYGFCELGLEKISGLCMSCNPASRRVMEKLGMKFEGTSRNELLKNGVYFDIDRLSILKSEYFGVNTICNS